MSKKKVEPLRLSIACGQNKPEGFKGVDIAKAPGVDYVQDLFEFPWSQFEDNSVDEIECSHFVEHIPHILEGKGMSAGFDDVWFLFFDEIHRILKPAEFDPNNPNIPTAGFMKIVAPYWSSMRSWQDPTHQRAISEASFMYLNKEWREINKLDHYPVSCNFNFTYGYNLSPDLVSRNLEFQQDAVAHKVNSANDIVVTLTKV